MTAEVWEGIIVVTVLEEVGMENTGLDDEMGTEGAIDDGVTGAENSIK